MITEGKTNGAVPIAYEMEGPEGGDPVVLLNGLGMQATQWPRPVLDHLHKEGFRTIRVDNRDVGLSGRMDGAKAPNPYMQLFVTTFGFKGGAPYRLEDMADDAVSVMDELDIGAAHVMGLSMGGIISQVLAARYKDRVKRLVLFMTTTNNRSLPRPKGEAAKILFDRQPPARSAEEATERLVAKWQFFMTADGGMSVEELRAFHRAAVERGIDPEGWKRQLAAIVESGDIRKATRSIKAPALIVHGTQDKLVPIEAGRDILKNLPGARMEEIEGMGHDLPPVHHERIGKLITGHLNG
jgi:proline iminopeptidase